MSDKKKKPCSYGHFEEKINTIDSELIKTQKEINELVRRMEENPDVCPDEVDSQKALQNVLEKYFIDDLLTKKPVGDA